MACKDNKGQAGETRTVPSKNMPAMPDNFAPIFFKNQFRTKIELPSKERYPDVDGKCAIITGSNTGLGYEAARQLLSIGLSHLVMGVRTVEKGKEAASKLRLASASAKIDVWKLDMESYDSIQAFVQKCQDTLPQMDIVILNAGTSHHEFSVVPATGHERTVQVNHLSTALLATLLLPVLKNKSLGMANPPHLTIVNSATAHLCKFVNYEKRPLLASFDDTSITKWDSEDRYGTSKLLNQLFLVKLADNVDSNDVIINMVDPGLTKGTSLFREISGATAVAAKMFFSVAGRPVDRGAATYIDAVLGQGRESHGCFLMNCEISPLARWYYTKGEALTDAVWTETLRELSFAGVEQIIASMSSSKK